MCIRDRARPDHPAQKAVVDAREEQHDRETQTQAEHLMQRMGLMNHQYIIIKHSGTESKKDQAHLHILVNRV